MHLGIAPVRISFAGGGTDMPEYYEIFGGNVVTTAISRFTYVIVNFRSDDFFQIFSPDFERHSKPSKFENLKLEQGTELVTSTIKYLNFKKGANFMVSSDVPPRSGLGGSSSITVNLVNTISTLMGYKLTKDELIEKSFDIARNYLKWPIGKQDEAISTHGGFNFIEFEKDRIKVTKIPLDKKEIEKLERRLLLFFIGGRTSSKVLSSQIKRTKQLDKMTLESLHEVKQLGMDLHKELRKSNIESFGEYLARGWNAKRRFANGVTDDRIDKLYETAIKHGASGGKLTGAGGGGHLLFYCEDKKQEKVIRKMTSLGLTQVKFAFEDNGARVHSLYDYSDTK